MAPTEIVVFKDGQEQPGWTLRAGDIIQETHYDHGKKLIGVYVDHSPSIWRIIWERITRRGHL